MGPAQRAQRHEGALATVDARKGPARGEANVDRSELRHAFRARIVTRAALVTIVDCDTARAFALPMSCDAVGHGAHSMHDAAVVHSAERDLEQMRRRMRAHHHESVRLLVQDGGVRGVPRRERASWAGHVADTTCVEPSLVAQRSKESRGAASEERLVERRVH